MLMALFAEDIGLLEKYFVTEVLNECKSKQDTYDLLGGLFEAMNTKGGVMGGRFKGVAYFNGGLFAEPARVELDADQRTLLKEASQFDWSKVRPEIFGTIFEHSLGKEARHASGAHFTSPVDIMKVVGPTIVAPWTELIERADTLGRLKELLAGIESFTVLDPACGSGNFLYVAYRELKRLEARIYERMATEYKSVDPQQRPFGFVSARNFYGMDINPFAVDLAKVTMMLAHKLSIDELHINENALPLDNLDTNFRSGDSLINADGTRAQWFKADVIVGNPPFLGAKLLKPAYGVDYVNKVRAAYPEVPGMADFCVYWFRRAHDELIPCTKAKPVAGRAGLVGTQNVRNNASRIGGLDYISATGTIVDAVDNQPWSGEANVNVSIANWVKTLDEKLVPGGPCCRSTEAPTRSGARIEAVRTGHARGQLH
jgi:type II restriction/modification system DNA methylase subunit YeeA